ncbi:MAG: DUF4832 domain-containing protein [Burkholderiaceae bacterium]
MQALTLTWGAMALCAAGLAACGGGEDESGALRSEGAASEPMARLRSGSPMVQVVLQPTDLDFPGPERGFYRFATDPSRITADSLLYVVQEGQRLVYTPADLSAYRTRSLPSSYLNKLDTGFANLRRQGLKAVLRFAYNYPETESEYLNAQDATLSRVKSHIQQLQPVLQRNADVIAVMQGGFIGAWGEWHTSSNNLTTPARKVAVRDALLQALPAQRLLQVRYPADLARWYPEPVTLAQWMSSSPPPAGRIGLHNDCFLASMDDVGTYFAETATGSQTLRTYAQQATAVTGAGGETCAPSEPTQARMTCADILREGAAYHMSYLNRDYYEGFFAQWQAGGCLAEVSRRLGYRLVLQTVAHSSTAVHRGMLAWSVTLLNQGWARPLNERSLVLSLVDMQGQTTVLPLPGTDLRQAAPGEPLLLGGEITLPATLAAGTYRVHLGAPDPAASLAVNPAYTLRFANADDGVTGVQWMASQGTLALGTTLLVQ